MTQEPQRLEGASLAALFGSVLLLVSPWLTWFAPGGSAWSLLELADVVLIATALYVGATATARLLDLAAPAQRTGVPSAGAVALAVVLATMLAPPPVAAGAELGFGAWLALLGSSTIVAAGLLDLARVSVTVRVGDRAADAGPAPDHPPASPAAPAPMAAPPAPASPPTTDAPPPRSPSLLRPSARAASDQQTPDERAPERP